MFGKSKWILFWANGHSYLISGIDLRESFHRQWSFVNPILSGCQVYHTIPLSVPLSVLCVHFKGPLQ